MPFLMLASFTEEEDIHETDYSVFSDKTEFALREVAEVTSEAAIVMQYLASKTHILVGFENEEQCVLFKLSVTTKFGHLGWISDQRLAPYIKELSDLRELIAEDDQVIILFGSDLHERLCGEFIRA